MGITNLLTRTRATRTAGVLARPREQSGYENHAEISPRCAVDNSATQASFFQCAFKMTTKHILVHANLGRDILRESLRLNRISSKLHADEKEESRE